MATTDRDPKPDNLLDQHGCDTGQSKPERLIEPPGGLVRRPVRRGTWLGKTRPR